MLFILMPSIAILLTASDFLLSVIIPCVISFVNLLKKIFFTFDGSYSIKTLFLYEGHNCTLKIEQTARGLLPGYCTCHDHKAILSRERMK